MLKIVKNPDTETYNKVLQKVKDNNSYCPCRLICTPDTKCPCKQFREQETEGLCHCGLLMKVEV